MSTPPRRTPKRASRPPKRVAAKRKRSSRALPKRGHRDVQEALYARRIAPANLVRSPVLGEGDIRRAVREITETAAQVMEVERASVWRLVEDGAAIECIDLYERSGTRHSAGVRIRAADVPRYFEALQQERAIRAHDARTDPRTSEFRSGYLEPLGIVSMLDAPVFLRGKMVGVVCHEHTGSPRRWKLHEELLAGTFADFVALVLETAAWHDAQEALRIERDALESKVDERTRALQASESNLRSLIDLSPVAMVLTRTTDHKIVFANRRAATLFEVPLDTIEGQSAPDFWVVPEQRKRYIEDLRKHGRVDDLEAEMRAQSGRTFWARVSAQRLRFAGEDTLLGTIVDITEQKRAQEVLRELATRDPLTGIYNRRHLEEVLHKEVVRAERHGRPLTVAMLDVDQFKRINDTYGHPTGDEVLREISERCQTTIRSTDVLGRYGGEEFVVIFAETELPDARIVSERLRSAIADRPVVVGDRAIEVTVSIGLAAFGRGQDLALLIERADAALYAAKEGGRNLVRTSGEVDAPNMNRGSG